MSEYRYVGISICRNNDGAPLLHLVTEKVYIASTNSLTLKFLKFLSFILCMVGYDL